MHWWQFILMLIHFSVSPCHLLQRMQTDKSLSRAVKAWKSLPWALGYFPRMTCVNSVNIHQVTLLCQLGGVLVYLFAYNTFVEYVLDP